MSAEGRILIIDDEPGVCDVCSLYLRRENFHVECIHQGDIALETIDRFQPDLIVLDLMLPGRDGWDICRAVRQRGSLPIIMLTARDDHEDRIQGLELGADDYIVKPFNPRELVARVKAVLRRFRSADAAAAGELAQGDGTAMPPPYSEGNPRRAPTAYTFGKLHLDVERHLVWLDGEEVALTPKEFDLLHLFLQRPGKTFTRTELLERLWGYDYFGDERTIDVHIKRLRRKIEPTSDSPRYIHTVWGVGYRFGER